MIRAILSGLPAHEITSQETDEFIIAYSPTRTQMAANNDRLVTDFPESKGMAAFINRLTKMVHFVPCRKEIIAEQYACLFIDHIFKLHGLPEVIISDRNPRF